MHQRQWSAQCPLSLPPICVPSNARLVNMKLSSSNCPVNASHVSSPFSTSNMNIITCMARIYVASRYSWGMQHQQLPFSRNKVTQPSFTRPEHMHQCFVVISLDGAEGQKMCPDTSNATRVGCASTCYYSTHKYCALANYITPTLNTIFKQSKSQGVGRLSLCSNVFQAALFYFLSYLLVLFNEDYHTPQRENHPNELYENIAHIPMNK